MSQRTGKQQMLAAGTANLAGRIGLGLRAIALGVLLLVSLGGCIGGLEEEPKQIFVKADTGLDTNPGTLTQPLKTIKRALAVWRTGREIVLIPSIFNEVSGETWPYDAPAGLVIKATASGVVLESNTPDLSGNLRRVGFNATQIQLENLTFRNFQRALVQSTGKQTLVGVRFEGGADAPYALELSKSAEASWSNVALKNSGVRLKDAAVLSVSGAAFEGDAQIEASDAAQVNLEKAQTPNGPASTILFLNQSAKASLKQSTLTSLRNVAYVNSSAQLTVENGNLTSTQSSAIRIDGGSLSLKGGYISGPQRYAVEASNNGTSVSVSIDGTGLYGQYAGVNMYRGSLQVKGARIATQREAIRIRGWVYLNLRDSTLETSGDNSNLLYIDTNGQAAALGTTDLGSAASPGNNVFKNTSGSASIRSLVYILPGSGTTLQVPARGNTWIANEQGANSTGQYPAGVNVSGPTPSGKNFYLGSGASMSF
ncbi:MAG: DUF1565 domain-containing protein [Meiothermus sp.]|nr:DUF1565 domain-containing protein [Meiothermus sp.]